MAGENENQMKDEEALKPELCTNEQSQSRGHQISGNSRGEDKGTKVLKLDRGADEKGKSTALKHNCDYFTEFLKHLKTRGQQGMSPESKSIVDEMKRNMRKFLEKVRVEQVVLLNIQRKKKPKINQC